MYSMGGGGGGGGAGFGTGKKKKKERKKKIHVCSAMVSLTSFSSFYFRILHHLYFGAFLGLFFFVIAVVSFSQRKGPRLASCWPILC